jgi:hypothetical protein
MEEEAILCATFEKNIAKLKKQLTDKTVIFDKLSQEIFRMLGLFERLERMGESRGTELMEAEQAVRQTTKMLLKTTYIIRYFSIRIIPLHCLKKPVCPS